MTCTSIDFFDDWHRHSNVYTLKNNSGQDLENIFQTIKTMKNTYPDKKKIIYFITSQCQSPWSLSQPRKTSYQFTKNIPKFHLTNNAIFWLIHTWYMI